jgi:AspT/YidE/YbjL antiporter-like protein
VLPVFVGILLGVILGSIPIALPGTPAPVRLGLAGGPLIVALVLSQIGRAGPLIWYLTPGANLVLREIGIVLFLACVGLKSGSRFLEVLISGSGVSGILAGAFLTLFPLLLVGFVARIIVKLDFATVCGVLAGSMTDPPALAFAGTITHSDRPLVAYAAVYSFSNDSAGICCPTFLRNELADKLLRLWFQFGAGEAADNRGNILLDFFEPFHLAFLHALEPADLALLQAVEPRYNLVKFLVSSHKMLALKQSGGKTTMLNCSHLESFKCCATN